ncbi:MAG: hypothetical protein KAS04_01780, partial [Candidatus Aenigmarchaeota archaeon]|nr:hypothetical protein [Candidatus Aenigmarchaeota archaeon]
NLDKLQTVTGLKNNTSIIDDDNFRKMLFELNDRRKNCLKGREKSENHIDADDAKIFIVDFRLMEKFPGLNGEEFAYNLLCFSDCKYIIGLNRYHMESTFDLTLMGNFDSYADLNISYQDLDNQGLWNGKTTGYRPWYWSNVLNYLKNREKQIREVEKNFNSSICETLKIPEHVMKNIPNSAGNYLGIDRKNISKMTFKDFFLKSNILVPRDLKNDFSVKRKAKIVASRLSKWFEMTILPGQDILVDAPHLVLGFPSLLRGNKKNISTWNKTTKFGLAKDLGIHHQKIKNHIFSEHWLSRPAWFWHDISEMVEIDEVKEPWKRKDFGFVFAEDASSFYNKNECKNFISSVESSFRERYIKDFRKKSVKYKPIQLLFKR